MFWHRLRLFSSRNLLDRYFMVEIHTLSVADFKHTMGNNDLYDSNIEQRADLAVISIGNSSEDIDPDDIFSNGPSSRWFRYQHKNVLNLTFDDITAPEKWQMMSQSATRSAGCSDSGENGISISDCILFDEEMARHLVRFVEENRAAKIWIVHCSAGVSRSGAVSRWLKDCLKFKYGIEANNVDGRYAVPNAYVMRVLDRITYTI